MGDLNAGEMNAEITDGMMTGNAVTSQDIIEERPGDFTGLMSFLTIMGGSIITGGIIMNIILTVDI